MYFYYLLKSFNRIEKLVFGGAFLIFATASILWLFLFFYSQTVQIPVESGLYAEGITGQPTFINPVISGSKVDTDLSELLFSNLLELADNYKVSEDGKIWNVSLKSDLLWSDGKPLTSDDVIFTIETIQDSNSRSPLFRTWQGVVADRVSELEIEFNLRTPFIFFLDNLKDLKIIPKHIFEMVPSANLKLSEYNLEPVGSGPYKFVSYEKKKDGFISDYHLTVNKNYILAKPFIEQLDIKFFPNMAELIKAFNGKKIDGFGDLSPKNIGDLKLSHQIKEITIPQYYVIFFNASSHEALKDKNVKLALELATDKEKIIREIFNNKAIILNQPLLPVLAGYNPEIETPQFSIEKSQEILENNGWKINSENGIRERKIGNNTVKLEFDIIVPQIQFLTDTINIIRDDWEKIGVKLNPIILNPADVSNEIIKARNYQMLLYGNMLKNNPDLFSFWHSSERFYPGLNLALYENKKVDNLLEAIRKNPDEEERNQSVKELSSLIVQDRPALFLYSPLYLYVSSPGLGGFDANILSISSKRFENINKWYLKTARVFK